MTEREKGTVVKNTPGADKGDTRRHTATLESLGCPVCGAGPFVECDITAHQDYANARFGCTVCGAIPGEICRPTCPAADALIGVLSAVQPPIPKESLATW